MDIYTNTSAQTPAWGFTIHFYMWDEQFSFFHVKTKQSIRSAFCYAGIFVWWFLTFDVMNWTVIMAFTYCTFFLLSISIISSNRGDQRMAYATQTQRQWAAASDENGDKRKQFYFRFNKESARFKYGFVCQLFGLLSLFLASTRSERSIARTRPTQNVHVCCLCSWEDKNNNKNLWWRRKRRTDCTTINIELRRNSISRRLMLVCRSNDQHGCDRARFQGKWNVSARECKLIINNCADWCRVCALGAALGRMRREKKKAGFGLWICQYPVRLNTENRMRVWRFDWRVYKY